MMTSCSNSRVNVEKTFISWKEKVASQRIEFFLQLQNFQWILAVVGVVTNHPNMEFSVNPAFYGIYKHIITTLPKGKWKRRCDVVAWLEAQISFSSFNTHNTILIEKSEHNSQVIMDAGDFTALIDTEDAKTCLAFPSGYNDAYSIPSRTQMVLKHGARNFDVIVEHGHFTHGWDYFVMQHEIQYGYVVKFYFRGCSTYEIEIFDSERGKKVYPWSNLNYHEWI